ncbi:right-handed parallel beta-helix repeat-containing protein [Alteromonas sp. K632G]|uniref:right-handed parallel beta-helix repeat-containing protein n=1 Tax=Alteromonas sp. K632G TaxID=2820757 RepID=UPI001AD69A7E|nr:right-handed parallel beta-helix repeat-containing protein [Alteromonas sp. K632G]MBO7921686.1 right-handed parallel beta-helix repeat-containing protein [Alteromonas sp. K632G]
MNFRMLKSKEHGLLVIIISMLFLTSCALKAPQNKQQPVGSLQHGALIQSYLDDSGATSLEELETSLMQFKANRQTAELLEGNTKYIAELYKKNALNLISQDYEQNSSLAEIVASTEKPHSTVSILVSLYPIDAYRLLSYFNANKTIEYEQLLAVAVDNNLDPSIVLAAAASGYENTVTPLIHSAGIVIYSQAEGSSSAVKYKEATAADWQPGLSLSWEPIYGALSGSIVHLNADTDYEVEIKITHSDGNTEDYSFNFRTRPNAPPINPNKIYYLSEIYNGGQLDLEALNIYGDEDGYAKIIGDGQVIEASTDFLSAVNIGSQSYIMLENLTIKGGERYGIFAKNTHHIWIKGCDISKYGRVATIFKNGKGYASENSTSPINYDSGIYLEKTGISVVEECEIHSPNGKANHWGDGHPNGPNALQVWAYHPDDEFRGQMIIRNNRFYGTDSHRFNDVIEGRKNFERTGGFLRDSAIYGNYLAFANDDLIEIDGGQRNVLVYENELTKGYAGISVAPNMLGPSYLFHNNIHDLGDERGKEWTAIKAGGLLAKPGGQTFILENYIDVARNGLSASGVNGDSTFWVRTQNNVIISSEYNNMVGLGIYDKYKYYGSTFTNDFIYNKKLQSPFLQMAYDNYLPHPFSESSEYATLVELSTPHTLLVDENYLIPNISKVSKTISTPQGWQLKPDSLAFTPFHDQTKYGSLNTFEDVGVTLQGNIWSKTEANLTITTNTILELDLEVEGLPEIVGLAFENDNKVTKTKIIQFYGSQSYGINAKSYFNGSTSKIRFPIGEYLTGTFKYLVLVLDNDISQSKNNTSIIMKNIKLEELNEALSSDTYNSQERIIIGLEDN